MSKRPSVRQLTPRESQVALLIARGLSDSEIGQTLVITTRTAEWHVEQILTKLGLKSRAHIAARVAEAEALGFAVPNAAQPQRPTAFLGWNPQVSDAHELLAMTRFLPDPSQDIESKREERLVGLAEAGYDPVIVGFVYRSALEKVARRYPKTSFAILDDDSLPADQPNVTSLMFAIEQASYLTGAIAARASKTETIGFIGGVETTLIHQFQAGYLAGSRAIKPGITVHIKYLTRPPDFTGFGDPVAAKAIADAMYGSGVDVLCHAAGGSGNGVFEAAKGAGALAIGADSDQYSTVAGDTRHVILTSTLKRVDVAVSDYLQVRAASAAPQRTMSFDLSNDGVGYSKSNPLVRPFIAMADDLREQIIAGRILVPERP